MHKKKAEVKEAVQEEVKTGVVEEQAPTVDPELAEKSAKLEETIDRLQRLAAEFDNYKKRTAKEKETLYHDGVGETVGQFLTVLDNLERAVSASEEAKEASTLLEGVQMVLKQFHEAFAKIGVQAIGTVGEKFDPNVHNAVMHVEDESVGESVILEEMQKGFQYKDKVIRYSMVKVAN
ncbi:MAG: nucleotide exchange factor GrpE [Hyphomonadaceae bacterium]|nr:nucleotide exchange factor GrpE [Clostridia bacterium]